MTNRRRNRRGCGADWRPGDGPGAGAVRKNASIPGMGSIPPAGAQGHDGRGRCSTAAAGHRASLSCARRPGCGRLWAARSAQRFPNASRLRSKARIKARHPDDERRGVLDSHQTLLRRLSSSAPGRARDPLRRRRQQGGRTCGEEAHLVRADGVPPSATAMRQPAPSRSAEKRIQSRPYSRVLTARSRTDVEQVASLKR